MPIYNCYYTGLDNGFGERKSLSKLQTQSTFVDWDFNTVWQIDPLVNDGLPTLRPEQTDSIIVANNKTVYANPSFTETYQKPCGFIEKEIKTEQRINLY